LLSASGQHQIVFIEITFGSVLQMNLEYFPIDSQVVIELCNFFGIFTFMHTWNEIV